MPPPFRFVFRGGFRTSYRRWCQPPCIFYNFLKKPVKLRKIWSRECGGGGGIRHWCSSQNIYIEKGYVVHQIYHSWLAFFFLGGGRGVCCFDFFEFFLSYRQYKVGISVNYFFPFYSFVVFIIVSHKFGAKMLLNLLMNYNVLKELVCQDVKLKQQNGRHINILVFHEEQL